MTRALVMLALLVPAASHAQAVVLRDAGTGQGAGIVRTVLAAPHAVRAGSATLELPRDSTITTSLLVLGRPTYLASRVQGDVVVVGADLFLRPGADVSGRAVAIGGTVAETSLGRVAGGVESLRDETFVVESVSGGYALDSRSLRVEESDPLFRLAGIKGVKIPKYDRVNGLSLPVGVVLQFGEHALELEPSATYRSRLGVVDGSLEVRTRESAPFRVVARVARDTRTNDAWIKGDLINSVTSLLVGSDARNYFRADLGEGRVIRTIERPAYSVAPYLGGRYEKTRPITAVGNVWSLFGRRDSLKMARPNPLVERGNIGSALAGAEFRTVGVVKSTVKLDLEQGFPSAAATFSQVTVDGSVELPTFRTHLLRLHAHGVGTSRAAAPRARYAYLGGGRTLRTLDLLEQGGTSLVYLESRYLVPIERITLPFVGSPMIIIRDAFGAAGVGSLPPFQHEIGAGITLGPLTVEYTRAVAGRKGDEFGVSVTLPAF